eukprot:7384974-Alexandrium_andersonii.AAC.1
MARSRCRVQGTRHTTLVVWSVASFAPYGARDTRHSSRRAFPGRRLGCVRGVGRKAHNTGRSSRGVWPRSHPTGP